MLQIGSKQNIVQSIKTFRLNWKDAKRMKDSRLPKLAYFISKGREMWEDPEVNGMISFKLPNFGTFLKKPVFGFDELIILSLFDCFCLSYAFLFPLCPFLHSTLLPFIGRNLKYNII
jgi:hypothetical protein